MCSCVSYNRPHHTQSTPSLVLSVPEWAPREENGETICVDACIAPVIEALWAERIWTLGCCCGHNGEFDRHIIVHRDDRKRAEEVVMRSGDGAIVGAWELVWSKRERDG